MLKLVRRKAVVAAKRMVLPANSETFQIAGYLQTNEYISLIPTVNVLVCKGLSTGGVIGLLFPFLVKLKYGKFGLL